MSRQSIFILILALAVALNNALGQNVPVINFAQFFGGTNDDAVVSVARDTNFTYLAGITRSGDFPVTNAHQALYGGDSDPEGAGDIFVMKRDAVTGEILWATYLGGSETDFGTGIAVDHNGNVVVSGWTKSPDFPFTEDAPQKSLEGASDGIVAKFDADGNLLFSSYFGGEGDDQFAGISMQTEGNFPTFRFAVAGFSTSADFPVTSTAGLEDTTINGGSDVVVMLFNSDCTVNWATFVGGAGNDVGLAVDHGGSERVLVAGYTESPNFPRGPFESYGGGQDAFLAIIDTFDARTQGRVVGGSSNDVANAVIRIDDDNFFIAGATASMDFQTTNPSDLGLSETNAGGTRDGFVVRYTGGGMYQRRISGYLGGSGDDAIRFLAHDGFAYLHAGGETTSTNLSVTNAVQEFYAGDPFDGFFVRFATTLNPFTRAITGQPDFLSYFGGDDNDTVTSATVSPVGEAPRALVFGAVSDSEELPGSAAGIAQSSTVKGDEGARRSEDGVIGEFRGLSPSADLVLFLDIIRPETNLVSQGEELEFEVDIYNRGEVVAENLAVAVTFDALTNLVLLSAEHDGEDISGNIILNTFDNILVVSGIGSLEPGDLEDGPSVLLTFQGNVLRPNHPAENPTQVRLIASVQTTTEEPTLVNNANEDTINYVPGEPRLEVAPAPLAFGDVNTGSSQALSVTLSNAGSAAFSITGIILADTNVFSIVSRPAVPFGLDPGQSEVVEMQFQPPFGSAGAHATTLNIFGTQGQNAEVMVTGNAVGVPRIIVTPPVLDFGNVLAGAEVFKTVAISNAGDARLDIGEIEFSGDSSNDFSATVMGTPAQFFSIEPGEATGVTVSLVASAAGAVAALMEVPSNDPDLPTYFVELSAQALAVDLELTVLQSVFIITNQSPALATTVRIFNRGAGDATEVTLQSTPQGLSPLGSAPEVTTVPGEPIFYLVYEAVPVIGSGQSATITLFDAVAIPQDSQVVSLDLFVSSNEEDFTPTNNFAVVNRPYILQQIDVSPENPEELRLRFKSFTGYEFIVQTADNPNGPYMEAATIEGQDNRIEEVIVPRGGSPRKFFRIEVRPLTI